MTRIQYDAMRSPAGSLLVGDPETVAAKIERWREVLGVERFMLHISVGSLPHDHVLRSIELLGTKVAPLVNGEFVTRHDDLALKEPGLKQADRLDDLAQRIGPGDHRCEFPGLDVLEDPSILSCLERRRTYAAGS